jgi:Rod binding domain-containing protein
MNKPVSLTRLKDAAHQFEASLMQEIMGPLDDAKVLDSGEDQDGKDAGSDALAAFARESMAKSLSAHGGFGIAESILHYFEKSGKAK